VRIELRPTHCFKYLSLMIHLHSNWVLNYPYRLRYSCQILKPQYYIQLPEKIELLKGRRSNDMNIQIHMVSGFFTNCKEENRCLFFSYFLILLNCFVYVISTSAHQPHLKKVLR
jgi:hypothetical protein